MEQVAPVGPEEFDWSSEAGPAAEVRRIARASTAHDGAVTLNEQALLQLKHRGLRGAELWLGSGGFALRHAGDVLDLVVHPESRRRGVGTALARAALPEGRKVDAWSHCDHPGAARLAELFWIPRERELVIMHRSLADLHPVEVPSGVTIRSFRPGDEEDLLLVNASAFAHHPEQGHMTLEDFQERTGEEWFDPAGLFLAVPSLDEEFGPAGSGGGGGATTLLGFHWTKEHRDEDPPYGEVYVVAVNPKAAGRGLGTVLTGVGLHHLRDRGLHTVLLYVDGDNDPAVAVYTGQGFEVKRTEVQYRGTSTGLHHP